MKRRDTDHCSECGSENLFSGHFDGEGLAVPLDGPGGASRPTPPGVEWKTFCNQCGAEQ